MEGKLIKVENGYVLMVDNIMHATDNDKLSLKNCQAIANGYDLEELACDKIGIDISVIKHIDRKVFENDSVTTPIHEAGALGAGLYHQVKGFEIGFETAVELLGDKKFNEEDIKRAFIQGVYTKAEIHRKKEEYIQSLQPTEWDVIIETEDVFTKNNDQYVNEVGVGNYSTHGKKVKLDKDGCLILKRK